MPPSSPVRRVLDRLPDDGARRPQLSVAAYRSAFDTVRDDPE
ncbi:MAG: hypothetical protein ABEJ92_11500 [Halobacteriales archaeon]